MGSSKRSNSWAGRRGDNSRARRRGNNSSALRSAMKRQKTTAEKRSFHWGRGASVKMRARVSLDSCFDTVSCQRILRLPVICLSYKKAKDKLSWLQERRITGEAAWGFPGSGISFFVLLCPRGFVSSGLPSWTRKRYMAQLRLRPPLKLASKEREGKRHVFSFPELFFSNFIGPGAVPLSTTKFVSFSSSRTRSSTRARDKFSLFSPPLSPLSTVSIVIPVSFSLSR